MILRVDQRPDYAWSATIGSLIGERPAANRVRGDHQNGARGEDVLLPVPDGTVVIDAATGDQVADLT